MADTLPWQQLHLVGQAELKFFIWPVYEARLYSGSGAYEFPDTRPFALSLEYKRQFSKQQLISETQKQWQLLGVEKGDQWAQTLTDVFSDVDKSDVITLYVDAQGNSVFYLNDTLLGRVNDPEFTEHFVAIWLSDQTSKPDFRADLLGRNL
ncbi:MAG: chalcone isomerase family protein [Gammaproteobacteria bacterium]|nr:chalcone isomerase family protein [Gammaproteobacteria bacterium]